MYSTGELSSACCMQGRWYMLVEQLSQSYRCILPVTPWIYFLTDDDDGTQLSFAKALLVAYVCFKVPHSTCLWHCRGWSGGLPALFLNFSLLEHVLLV